MYRVVMHLKALNGDPVAEWLWAGDHTTPVPTIVCWIARGGPRYFVCVSPPVHPAELTYVECAAPVEIGKL